MQARGNGNHDPHRYYTIHSEKVYSVFKCRNEKCGHTWKSVHGWTEGFPQRCTRTIWHGKVRGPCGRAGEHLYDRITRYDRFPEDKNVSDEGVSGRQKERFGGESLGGESTGGSHRTDFCDMCAKLKEHNLGFCTNKTDVFITGRDTDGEVVQCRNGPPPTPN